MSHDRPHPQRNSKPGFKITQIHAFISTEKDGTEGVIAFQHDGQWFPMISADMQRLDSWRHIAKEIGQKGGVPVTLARFGMRTNEEQVTGPGGIPIS